MAANYINQRSAYALQVTEATATAAVTTSSGTFSVMTGMTITPTQAGTYLVIFNGSMYGNGINTEGEFAIFVGGTQQTDSTRGFTINVNVLGLTLGDSRIRVGGSLVCIVSVNGSQAIDARFRSLDGVSLGCQQRTLTLVRLS